MTISSFLLALVAIFVGARLFGALAERFGQPAVLGELVAGLLVGPSLLGLVDPHAETIRLLSELGVLLLLFEIGLETDLGALLSVGGTSLAVAVVGIVLPLGLGMATGLFFGESATVSLFLGAALTATSVGITARVLSDLGRLRDPESRIVLGAAVIDDILGLVLLAIVGGIAAGRTPSALGIARITVTAVGFVVVAVAIGSWLVPRLLGGLARIDLPRGTLTFFGLVFAFVVSEAAEASGSALVVGAFAAGVVLARTREAHTISEGVTAIAQFFVPIFFVSVGAAVELRAFDPRSGEGRRVLALGAVLLVVGIVGKVAAGLAVRGRGLRRLVVGVGMVPRGEVGLIFARMGLASGVLAAAHYGAVTMMVLGTTFLAPPWLRRILGPARGGKREEPGAVAELSTSAPFDEERPAG